MGGFFTTQLGPFPLWVWIVVLVGGVVLYFVIRHFTGQNSASSGATTTAQNPYNPTNDPNIDPNTGVPYSLEEMIDPNTGEPYYYEQGYGGNTSGGTTTPPPSQPPTGTNPVATPPHILNPGPGKPPVQTPPISGVPIRNPGPPPTAHPGAPGGVNAPPQRFGTVTVRPWPASGSSLYSIWQGNSRGISWSEWEPQVLKLNPQITNPNLIYPNEKIKVPA